MKELSAREAWRAALGELQLQLPKATFETWLKQTEGVDYDERNFVVEVPTAFAIAMLERRMYQAIQKTVEKITGQPLDIQFQVKAAAGLGAAVGDTPGSASVGSVADATRANVDSTGERAGDDLQVSEALPRELPAAAPAIAPSATLTQSFNRKYSFATFVAGPSNQLAFSAAQAVADAPGQRYNPLFLYSGVGLGKTHLLHAIGQACANKGFSVRFVSAEQFTNDFISAIRNGTTEEFRDRYRSVQVLLIDDVQFISGKDQTQEMFFHTFNDLHNAGHQIVLTSDRPPRAVALLADRLRSRFEWGLIADIQPPDLETRMAILSAKAGELGMPVGDSVIELIAKRVQKNVRELEGSLNRVVAFAQLMNTPITLESTSRMLDDLTSDTARHAIDPERIIEEVSQQFKVSVSELLGKGRRKNLAQARQVAMYLLTSELEMSPTDVGRLLGDRDHSTVIHGAGKINGEINEDAQLRQNVLSIKEAIFT